MYFDNPIESAHFAERTTGAPASRPITPGLEDWGGVGSIAFAIGRLGVTARRPAAIDPAKIVTTTSDRDLRFQPP